MSRVAASPYIHNMLHTYTEQKIIKIKTSVELLNEIDTLISLEIILSYDV